MYLNYDSEKVQKEEFKEHLKWFEEEFDEIFQNKGHNYSKDDKNLANLLLNRLSESINDCNDEHLLYDLVSTLNNIERKHPDLF
jgi:arsenate reductase-like glutaredoxin family protein